jgi:hypothetical protein
MLGLEAVLAAGAAAAAERGKRRARAKERGTRAAEKFMGRA